MQFVLPLFSFLKKIFIVVFVFFVVITLFIYLVRTDKETRQVNYLNYQRDALYAKVQDPELKKTEEGKLAVRIYRGIVCGLLGEVCTDNPGDVAKNKPNSFFGKITGWVATPLAIPPASGIGWVKNGVENAGLVPQAYAAEGIGFSSIKGYLGLWQMFRNISFLLLVLLMLVIGFLIMFRVKIDAQTVISIENFLPRIVICMLFISFSFAIVGFMIDLMYLLIGISVDLIMGYGQGHDAETVAIYQNDFVGAKFNDLWPPGRAAWSFFGVGSSLWNMVPVEFKAILDVVITKYLASYLVHANLVKWEKLLEAASGVGIEAASFGINAGNLPKIGSWLISIIATGAIAYFLPGIILGLIILLTVLFLMFRLFFLLLSSYIKIILYLIFSPIILLLEAVPGQNTFDWWIRNVAGELIVFPTVVVIMLVGNAILDINGTILLNNNMPFAGSRFINPSPNTFLLPFLYGFRPQDFSIIVGLGIILLIPDFIKIVKGWIGVSESPLNLSMMTFFQGGAALVGGAMGGASTFKSMQHSLVGGNPYAGVLDSIPWTQNLAKNMRSKFENQSGVTGPVATH